MAGVPNFAETYINALSAGRQQRKQQAQDQAFQMVGSDPEGAQNALLQAGDYQGAAAVGQIGAQQRKLKVQTDIAPMVQKGDFAGASRAAVAGGDTETGAALLKMSDAQLEHGQKLTGILASTTFGLGQIPLSPGPDPLAARKAKLQELTPHLVELGVPQEEIDKQDLSDQGLKARAMAALSTKDLIDNERQDRQLNATIDNQKAERQQAADNAKETSRNHRAEEAAARQRAAGEGWQTLTDPGNGNQPFRYNARTGQATTLDGSAAYSPKSAAKMGSNSVRSPAMAAMLKFNEENPNATADQIAQFGSKLKAQAKATGDFATGKQGDAVRRINVSLSHLDTLAELGDALDNGNIQLLNKAKNDFQQAFGVAAPTNFDAAKQFVMNEVTAATLGGQGGVGDREKTNNAVSRASSPKQLAGVIKNTVQPLLAGQLHGLKQQYKTSTGLDNFESLLSPETVAKLETAAPAAAGNSGEGWKVIKVH